MGCNQSAQSKAASPRALRNAKQNPKSAPHIDEGFGFIKYFPLTLKIILFNFESKTGGNSCEGFCWSKHNVDEECCHFDIFEHLNFYPKGYGIKSKEPAKNPPTRNLPKSEKPIQEGECHIFGCCDCSGKENTGDLNFYPKNYGPTKKVEKLVKSATKKIPEKNGHPVPEGECHVFGSCDCSSDPNFYPKNYGPKK
jgi:hypothetical protein